MIEFVLDASALMALLHGEPGGQSVRSMLERSAVGAVNYAEVLARMIRAGIAPQEALTHLDALGLLVMPLDEAQVRAGADLAHYGWTHGLSLGDRACLTLARHLAVPAITADRRWDIPGLPVEVQFIR